MRVALVCPYSLSRPGGVQGQVTGLARTLAAAGHPVTVVAPDDDRPVGWLVDGPGPAGRSRPARYVAGGSAGVRANGSVAPICLDPVAARRAARAVAAFGADVVHLHEPLAPLLGYGILAAHRLPAVGTYHRSGDSAVYRLLGPLARWADGRLDIRCAVSAAAAETAAGATGDRPVEILFNGVEVDRFAGARAVPAPGGPAVLFLGRHERRKGLDVLLEAFGRARWTGGGPGPVLWVAGDGPETARLRQRYGSIPGVEWLGVIDDDEVPARLAAAAVLCAPSRGGESFGMVLLEAMAAGCAVVASDIPGYRAAAGGHAQLVAPGDPVALAGALERVVAAVGARPAGRGRGPAESGGAGEPEAVRAARHHAEARSMDRLAARYLELYGRAVAARSGDR